MKATMLIDAILKIDVNCRERWESKREYFENEVKGIFYDFIDDESKSLNKEIIEDYVYDAELTIKESSLKEIIKED